MAIHLDGEDRCYCVIPDLRPGALSGSLMAPTHLPLSPLRVGGWLHGIFVREMLDPTSTGTYLVSIAVHRMGISLHSQ